VRISLFDTFQHAPSGFSFLNYASYTTFSLPVTIAFVAPSAWRVDSRSKVSTLSIVLTPNITTHYTLPHPNFPSSTSLTDIQFYKTVAVTVSLTFAVTIFTTATSSLWSTWHRISAFSASEKEATRFSRTEAKQGGKENFGQEVGKGQKIPHTLSSGADYWTGHDTVSSSFTCMEFLY
jgi:hypothetical protein